jgi:capsular polysaccharide biosynthesis protein
MEVFYLLLSNIVWIILCMVLGAAIAFGYTYFCVTPLYQSTAKLYMVSASSNSLVNLSDLQLGSQLTGDYKELMKNRTLMENVVDSLGLNCSWKSLSNMISITNPSDTRLLYITVTSSDPQLAADIANEVAVQAVEYLPRVMDSQAPNIAEEAIPATQKSSPDYASNTIKGGMLGAVLICALVVVRYLLNDTFVTPDDLQRYFGVQPLAVIPEGRFDNRTTHSTSKKGKHEKPKSSSTAE